MEFILSGTVVKYFIIAWRYGGFFLFPLLYLVGMAWLSIGLTRFAVGHLGLPYPMLIAPALWLAIFVALRWTFGRSVHIGYALDDWHFARDFIHRARTDVDARLDRLAAELVRLVRETDADEIIVHGHSLGAPLSLCVIDRALQLDPQLGARGKPLHVVSTGSSLLKVALHPAAGWLREAVGRVANAPAIYWVEYQALVDIINVYKVDPVVALGLPATGKPIVKIFRIRMMVEEHTYRRFHLNFLRIHRQAVMGNERRYFYDYYMLCCGPLPLARMGREGGASGRGVCRRWRVDRGAGRQTASSAAAASASGVRRDGDACENHLARLRHRLVAAAAYSESSRAQDAGALFGAAICANSRCWRLRSPGSASCLAFMSRPISRGLPIIPSCR